MMMRNRAHSLTAAAVGPLPAALLMLQHFGYSKADLVEPLGSSARGRDIGPGISRQNGSTAPVLSHSAGFGTKSLWRQALAGKLLGAKSAARARRPAVLRCKLALLASFLPPRRVATPGEPIVCMNLEPGC
jgi:hypothetical protein